MDLKSLSNIIFQHVFPEIEKRKGKEVSSIPEVEQLHQKVKSLTEEAYADLKIAPQDENLQASLRIQLKKALEESESVRKELEKLVLKLQGKQPNVSINKSKNIVSGNINAHNVHIGDQIIHQADPKAQELAHKIEALKEQLDVVKLDILRHINFPSPKLEEAILGVLRQSSPEDSRILVEVYKQLPEMLWRDVVEVYEALQQQLLFLKGFQNEVAILKTQLSDDHSIEAKVRLTIPFLPFMAAIHEDKYENPLRALWYKCKNIVL